jgi:cytochrome c biogenesis protein CcmG, thiol:disulfide interchange protein DsbE
MACAGDLVGQSAQALIVTTLDGKTVDLASLRGKVVLVNYWATWCAPCREEMPTLSAFYRAYHERGLEMIGISVDQTARSRARAQSEQGVDLSGGHAE